MRFIFLLVLIAGGLSGGYYWYQQAANEQPPTYRLATVVRGDLASVISATGVVQPEEVVDVGAQVAGKINILGKDPKSPGKTIDYTSEVEDGTILAQIDDAVYKAQLAQAKANLARTEADLLQMRAKLQQAQREWKRAQTLVATRAISQSDYDLAEANEGVARAALAVGEASIDQARAALDLAETNVGYTTIRSPVKGVIVDRRVNIGQTVVASLNAPSLFLIAKDLRRMQVWASVNEADIGRIHRGQKVRFTVDAYPDKPWEGEVTQIRLNATMTQNVVTYTVVVTTENPEGKLLPYLTANLQFQLQQRTGVLKVPSMALSWDPPPEHAVPEARHLLSAGGRGGRERGKEKGLEAREGGRPGGDAKAPGGKPPVAKDSQVAAGKGKSSPGGRQRRLWVVDGTLVRPVTVDLGITDGAMTEVSGPEVHEGMEVVLGEVRRESASGTTNPFAPKLFNRGAQKSSSP